MGKIEMIDMDTFLGLYFAKNTAYSEGFLGFYFENEKSLL